MAWAAYQTALYNRVDAKKFPRNWEREARRFIKLKPKSATDIEAAFKAWAEAAANGG